MINSQIKKENRKPHKISWNTSEVISSSWILWSNECDRNVHIPISPQLPTRWSQLHNITTDKKPILPNYTHTKKCYPDKFTARLRHFKKIIALFLVLLSKKIKQYNMKSCFFYPKKTMHESTPHEGKLTVKQRIYRSFIKIKKQRPGLVLPSHRMNWLPHKAKASSVN